MAAPSTGVTWVNSGLAEMVRDYAGSATDLSPGGTFGSPFALDGQIRNDLLITTPVSVSATNCGFWLGGALDPNGVSRKPKVTSDYLMILQSNSPIRSDIQEESKTVVFRCFQNKPLLDRLRMNKPLSTIEDVGTTYLFPGQARLEPVRRAAADSDPIGSGRRTGRAHRGTVYAGCAQGCRRSRDGQEECRRACSTAPTSRHCGTSARRRRRHDQPPDFLVWIRGSGPCRRGPTPTGHRHGPPTSNREAATQAAWRDTALLSIGGLRAENAALQIGVDELTLALALINADNNQLRRELAAIRIERNTFRAEAMTA
jgi:hypothetical protein